MGNQLAPPSKQGVEHSTELLNVVFKETLGEYGRAVRMCMQQAVAQVVSHMHVLLCRPREVAQVPALPA
jgi:hypothetical protein